MEELFALFPEDRHDFWRRTVLEADRIQEIRLRIGQAVLIRRPEGDCYLDESGDFTDRQEDAHRAYEEELEALLSHICHDSPYAYEDELRQGFITAPGGHRIGLAGQAVLENERTVRTLKHIYYMNIRISHQYPGVADKVLPDLYRGGELRNILIVSAPGGGKTTMLRELVRRISDGNPWGAGLSVGVVDERSELAGSYLGRPRNDLGSRTDVLDACPKALGMMLLLRSMAPQAIAVDELGSAEDMAALRRASACGCHILATVHGGSPRDAARKFPELMADQIFDCLLMLGRRDGRPEVLGVYRDEEVYRAFAGRDFDRERVPRTGIMVPGPVFRKTPRSVCAPKDAGAVSERDPIWEIDSAGVL